MFALPLHAAVFLQPGGSSVGPAAVLEISRPGLFLGIGVPALIVVVLYVLFDRYGGREPETPEVCPACGATPAGDSLYCADCRAASIRRK